MCTCVRLYILYCTSIYIYTYICTHIFIYTYVLCVQSVVKRKYENKKSPPFSGGAFEVHTWTRVCATATRVFRAVYACSERGVRRRWVRATGIVKNLRFLWVPVNYRSLWFPDARRGCLTEFDVSLTRLSKSARSNISRRYYKKKF